MKKSNKTNLVRHTNYDWFRHHVKDICENTSWYKEVGDVYET